MNKGKIMNYGLFNGAHYKLDSLIKQNKAYLTQAEMTSLLRAAEVLRSLVGVEGIRTGERGASASKEEV